jgi:hypothetical protein
MSSRINMQDKIVKCPPHFFSGDPRQLTSLTLISAEPRRPLLSFYPFDRNLRGLIRCQKFACSRQFRVLVRIPQQT